MAISLTVLPLRALHFIKRTYPRETFETVIGYLFHCFWGPASMNLTKPENVIKALSEVPRNFKAGSAPGAGKDRLFSAQDVEAIMKAASSQEIKDALKATTQDVLDRGAFGAPWLWVTNGAGEAESFFGSDR